MRCFLLVLIITVSSAAAAECPRDTSGVQRTKNFDYWIDDLAAAARTPGEFLNSAANFLYFMEDGLDLQSQFVDILRIRHLPIFFPACNDIGQCATVSVKSIPLELKSMIFKSVHTGFLIDVEFAHERAYRFYQTDSRVFWSDIPTANAGDKRCRDNSGYLLNPDEPPTGTESEAGPSQGGSDGGGGADEPIDDGSGSVDDPVGIFWFYCRKEGTHRQLYANSFQEAEQMIFSLRSNGWTCFWQ